MLKITQTPEFTHRVKVRIPVDGGFSEQEFDARFRVVPWDELKALDDDPAEQARRIWVGWKGIVDDEGNELPFSDGLRDQLLGMLFLRIALLRTYMEAIAGVKRGN